MVRLGFENKIFRGMGRYIRFRNKDIVCIKEYIYR